MSPLLAPPVLAALVIAEHEHHDRASAWLAGLDSFAVCPTTEAGLVRFLMRLGESPQTALDVLAGINSHPGCESWADDAAFTDVPAEHLHSADLVTDAYLVALAARHESTMATLDPHLVQQFGSLVTLIPE